MKDIWEEMREFIHKDNIIAFLNIKSGCCNEELAEYEDGTIRCTKCGKCP